LVSPVNVISSLLKSNTTIKTRYADWLSIRRLS
jgi:hypothetical protein